MVLVYKEEEQSLRELDLAVCKYQKYFNFLALLRPTNISQEFAIFVSSKGNYNPVFSYNKLSFERIIMLQEYFLSLLVLKNQGYKSGIALLLFEKIEEYLLKLDFLKAFSDSDYSSLQSIGESLFGKIDDGLLLESHNFISKNIVYPKPSSGRLLSRDEVKIYLANVLKNKGYFSVEIVDNPHSLYRFSVSYGSSIAIHLGSFSFLDEIDLQGVIVHEIDVHLARYFGGKKTGWNILQIGTAYSLSTEEGLAIYSHSQFCKKFDPDYINSNIYTKYLVASLSSSHSFSELAHILKEYFPQKKWASLFKLISRFKMGIVDTGDSSSGYYFARDKVFLEGYHLIVDFLDTGGSLDQLLFGKIKLSDISKLS